MSNGIPSITELKDLKGKSSLNFSSFESILTLFSPNYNLILNETQLPQNCNWFPLPLALSPFDKC